MPEPLNFLNKLLHAWGAWVYHDHTHYKQYNFMTYRWANPWQPIYKNLVSTMYGHKITNSLKHACRNLFTTVRKVLWHSVYSSKLLPYVVNSHSREYAFAQGQNSSVCDIICFNLTYLNISELKFYVKLGNIHCYLLWMFQSLPNRISWENKQGQILHTNGQIFINLATGDESFLFLKSTTEAPMS